MPPTQSPVHLLLTHFWEAVAEDLAVEFAAAAQGNGGGGCLDSLVSPPSGD